MTIWSALACAALFPGFLAPVGGCALSRGPGRGGAAAATTTVMPEAVGALQAEGYGASSRGGQGGRVLLVTTLADDGPGSLRRLLESPGPRTIRFAVGGVLHLEKRIIIRQGRLTLEGLSAAPHGGLTIEGGVIIAGCEDVIIRHLRFRGGYDPLEIVDSRRVLIDHVSTAWAADENLSVWNSTDVTLQWSIMAEGLADGGHPSGVHSMGSLQSGGSTRVTTHHCLFISNLDRNPLVSGPHGDDFDAALGYRFDVVNNLIYNYWNGAKVSYGAQVNMLGNTFRPGPDTNPGRAEIFLHRPLRSPYLYAHDNSGPHRPQDDVSQHAGVQLLIDAPLGRPPRVGELGPGDVACLVPEPWPTPAAARVRIDAAAVAYTRVLEQVGAWPRDAADERFIREVRQGSGMVGRVGPDWRRLREELRNSP